MATQSIEVNGLQNFEAESNEMRLHRENMILSTENRKLKESEAALLMRIQELEAEKKHLAERKTKYKTKAEKLQMEKEVGQNGALPQPDQLHKKAAGIDATVTSPVPISLESSPSDRSEVRKVRVAKRKMEEQENEDEGSSSEPEYENGRIVVDTEKEKRVYNVFKKLQTDLVKGGHTSARRSTKFVNYEE